MAKTSKKITNVPNLRFPEFNEEWEEKKLGEVLDFKVTNSFSRDNLNYESGQVKNIHYGDIHTKFQTLFDIRKEIVPFIKNDISLNRVHEDCYCREGDIIFADASEDLNDVGKSVEIINLNNEKLLSGLHTLLARPKGNTFIKGFSGYLFKSDSIRKQIQKEAQGTKVLSISSGRISKIALTYPKNSEQQKIASFLSLIDERIQTQNQIIEDLKLLKSTLVDKLFNQTFRLNELILKWEEYSFSSLFDLSTKKNTNNIVTNILSASQAHGMISREDIDIDIKFDKNSIKSYKIVESGDYIIHLRSFQGGFAFSDKKGICSPAYTILRPNSLLIYGFLREYFTSKMFINSLKTVTYGIRDGRSINVDEFLKMKILLPSIHEQKQIINIIATIDEKIKTNLRFQELLLKQKQHLLTNLFI